ncbi:DNA translocase FtsK 4TM domain-containing protein [Ectothiorhodospiraceae bacterium 2226]|nr:DNA translocase FtsK 4TM domain-containing protein [Ectothiorhodospiraceae bacterium 2226]
MSQASRKKNPPVPLAAHIRRGLREGALFVFGFTALYLILALGTYHPEDPGWSYSTNAERVANLGGPVGAWFADVFLHLFGYMAFVFPVIVGYVGWVLFAGRKRDAGDEHEGAGTGFRLLGFALTLGAGSGLAALHVAEGHLALPQGAGGILGSVIGAGLVNTVDLLGATLFLLALFLTGVTLATGISWFGVMDRTGAAAIAFWRGLQALRAGMRERRLARQARQTRETHVEEEKKKREKRQPLRIEPVIKATPISARAARERQVPLFKLPADSALPPLSLLDPPQPATHALSKEALEAISRQVEIKLKDFNIEVEVVAAHPGPVITRFEMQPAPGVKVSQISNLAKDLARALSVVSVRIVEVIPGKSTVGLEIPNEHRETVSLVETLQSREYADASSALTLALGKDIAGRPVVADLGKMPHLLVAGTTGSGKSVGINAMILSLLFNATPQQVRLIMIDPKMLELSVYQGIPHLLAPVVTDMKEAANALRWCVAEMERRYRLMSSVGVRNLAGFNRKVKDAQDAGKPLVNPFAPPPGEDEEPETLEPLPYIVVVIDEFADMMMIVGKKVEELIARLAQKARAAGVHLILATQRPSVDVITGLIKANIPTRISFQVSSRVDSRTILDQNGAEHLLGHGDMLYLPAGTGLPQRVHGAFVADQEVHRVADHLKEHGEPDYLDEILQGGESDGGGNFPGDMASDEEADPLYDQAVRMVTETRRASISAVQRRLKIGYNRAARMVEVMEQQGVVGPLQSNGSREVLAPPPPPID